MDSGLKRLLLATILLCANAQAGIYSYQLSENDGSSTCGSVRTTEYEDGSCPLTPTDRDWET
jgi:hypothetical protein